MNAAALVEHESFCPAVRLPGLTDVRSEQYVLDRRDENDKVIGRVHCLRCMECGEVLYTDLA